MCREKEQVKSMMMSCKEVVMAVSSEDRPHWRRKIAIRFHLMICEHCSKFAKHLEILKSGIKALVRSSLKKNDDSKIRDLENKVIDQLKTK